MKDVKQKPIPEVNKEYHFFDDGKISNSRHYVCKIVKIIPFSEAKNVIAKNVPTWDFENNCNIFEDKTLLECFNENVKQCHWLYSPVTDVIVEASCPEYDENNLFFIRTLNGGWFSMDIQSSWQGGRLDIDGHLYEQLMKFNEEYDKL